jgi:hypothetical protein
MSFLDSLLGAISYGVEVTQLGAIDLGAEVRAALAQSDVVAPTWHRARRQDLWRRAKLFNHKACLAQSVECKAFNLVVLGSSLSGHSIFFWFCHLFVFLSKFFVYVADLSVQIYFSSSFFC